MVRFRLIVFKEGGSCYEDSTDTEVEGNPTINSNNDTDDFFYVTQLDDFELCKENGYNVIKEKSNPEDDGSLSVYANLNEIRYINIETENDDNKVDLYKKMLQLIFPEPLA